MAARLARERLAHSARASAPGAQGGGPPYENLRDESITEGLEQGHLSVRLEGHKLKGGYSRRRTRDGEKPQWLLVKRRDDEADARRNPVSTHPESVLSGRTIEDLQSE